MLCLICSLVSPLGVSSHPPVPFATQATAHLYGLHVSLFSILQVAYRTIQIFLVHACVVGDAFLELADLWVGGPATFTGKAERHDVEEFRGGVRGGCGACETSNLCARERLIVIGAVGASLSTEAAATASPGRLRFMG